MAKKKEKEAQEKKTFEWTSFGDSVPFALDYSAKELQERWKISRGFITAFITKFPSFEDFFLRMRYTEGAIIKGDTYKMKGVPAEVEPFFRFYIEEAQKNQWYFIKGKENFPLTIDEENLAEFEKFFCRELYKKATEAEYDQTIPGLKQETIQQTTKETKTQEYIADSTISSKEPSNLYWYRRLFNNRAFQKEISLDYWKKEYSYRCDLVRDLSLQLPYDAQIHQLQKAICSMDTQIAAMLHLIEISDNKKEQKKQEKQTGFLETFPTELLKELRTTIINPKAGNTRVVYSVDNIDVSAVIAGKQEKHKLEKFFDRIKKTNDQSLETRQAIRPYYLRNVCKVPEKSKFQVACEALQQYLDFYIDDNRTDNDLLAYVIQRCKMYYQYFMWFMGAYTGAFLPGVPSSAGDYLVIEQLISSMYTTFYFQHLEAITFVSVYGRDLQNQIGQRKKEIEAHIKTGDSLEHTYKIFSDRYVYLVKLLCSDFLPMESKLLEKELSPEKISAISRDMESGCKAYYEAYGSTAYDWMNETHFNGLWKRYNALILIFDNTIDPAGTREEDFQLCAALLMSRVWRECLSTANATFNTFNALKKHLMQRKGGSHNTTHQDGTVKQEGWK